MYRKCLVVGATLFVLGLPTGKAFAASPPNDATASAGELTETVQPAQLSATAWDDTAVPTPEQTMPPTKPLAEGERGEPSADDSGNATAAPADAENENDPDDQSGPDEGRGPRTSTDDGEEDHSASNPWDQHGSDDDKRDDDASDREAEHGDDCDDECRHERPEGVPGNGCDSAWCKPRQTGEDAPKHDCNRAWCKPRQTDEDTPKHDCNRAWCKPRHNDEDTPKHDCRPACKPRHREQAKRDCRAWCNRHRGERCTPRSCQPGQGRTCDPRPRHCTCKPRPREDTGQVRGTRTGSSSVPVSQPAAAWTAEPAECTGAAPSRSVTPEKTAKKQGGTKKRGGSATPPAVISPEAPRAVVQRALARAQRDGPGILGVALVAASATALTTLLAMLIWHLAPRPRDPW
ncbi:MAG: hypothetical protein QOJ13_443 [Gaiellales bacterium]|jgi:hypothetical protein|nr:hypothetical protein [Gaiellales bacterium]